MPKAPILKMIFRTQLTTEC